MKEFKSYYKQVKGNEGDKCNYKNDCCNLRRQEE